MNIQTHRRSVVGQRPRLCLPADADRRGLPRRLRAGLSRARDRRRADAELRADDEDGANLTALSRDAELHQPEQPLDRHRPPAGGARHLRATTSTTARRGKEVMMNDPSFLRAPTIFEGVPRRRRQGRGGDRQGQAARAARQGPRHVDGRAIASRRRRPTRRPCRRTASTMSRAASACRCRRSIRPSCRSSSSRRACQLLKAMRPDLMYLSTTDYVQHKYAPGSRGRERVLRHVRPLPRRARRARARCSCSPPTTA